MILKGTKNYCKFQSKLQTLSNEKNMTVSDEDLLLPEIKDCVEFVHEEVINKVTLQIILPTLLFMGVTKMAHYYYSF